MKIIKAIFNVLVILVCIVAIAAMVVYGLYMRGLEIQAIHKILEMP